jgi:hypothetical protein
LSFSLGGLLGAVSGVLQQDQQQQRQGAGDGVDDPIHVFRSVKRGLLTGQATMTHTQTKKNGAR